MVPDSAVSLSELSERSREPQLPNSSRDLFAGDSIITEMEHQMHQRNDGRHMYAVLAKCRDRPIFKDHM